MKYKLIYTPIFCLLFLFTNTFCKKKKTETVESTPITYVNTPIANGLPANTSQVNGVFIALKFFQISTMYSGYQSYASFNSTAKPLQSINPSAVTIIGKDNAGSLKINANNLYFETSNPLELNTYIDGTTNANYSSGVTWSLTGVGAFSSFSTSVSRGFPALASNTFIPASFSKSNGLTLNFGLANISNTDSIIAQINGNSFNISKTVAASATSISFSSAELSSTYVGMQNAQIDIYIKNYSNMIVNNKTYVFIMSYLASGSADINP